MNQASQHGPFLHLFVVCTAFMAVLLNTIVLVLGGGFVLAWESLFSHPRPGVSLLMVAAALFMSGSGISNLQCMMYVFARRERAGTRVIKVANAINGLLIALSAYMVFTGAGPIESALIFATAASTLIAIHVGRTKPIPAGHCQTCGYDLAGLADGVCPECGH